MAYRYVDSNWEFIPDEPDGNWQLPYQYRVVVPEQLILNPELLIFKVYADLVGLPIEYNNGNYYLYCNEILPEHQVYIDLYKLTLEHR